jgi:hypothetical protein
VEFCIHKDILGSSSHLLVNESEKEWIEDLPDIWTVGESSPAHDLLGVLKLCGTIVDIRPPNKFNLALRQMTFQEKIPWQMALPSHEFEKYVESIVSKVRNAFFMTDLSYYKKTFDKTQSVLKSLRPSKINKKMFKYLSTHDIPGVNEAVVDSFEPNKKGFADFAEYDPFTSLSGRLKWKSGPQILRLNKELKVLFKSRYKGGKILQFDYISAEPRIALILAGREASEDIYTEINKEVFNGKFDRGIVKQGCLSALYGAGAKTLSETTGLSQAECQSILPKIKEYFNVFAMTKKLVKEFKDTGMIRNHFGRCIYPEDGAGHKLYNHFIQSTAVDACMFGFWNILKDLDDRIIPLFIIHDNFILDFPKDLVSDEIIEEIKKNGSKVPKIGKLLLGCDSV